MSCFPPVVPIEHSGRHFSTASDKKLFDASVEAHRKKLPGALLRNTKGHKEELMIALFLVKLQVTCPKLADSDPKEKHISIIRDVSETRI